MSSCFLIAPIQIEAIHLQKENGYLAVEPMANFQNLPYCDRDVYLSKETQQSLPNNRGYDFEAATPYISENIVSQPFQNRNLHLSPGIHLHWNLPDALKTGTYKQENLTFITAPNRWLVIRKRGDVIEHQWIIESDYIWLYNNKFTTDTEQNIPSIPRSVSIPIEPNENSGQYQPFRYLGRQISLEDWWQESSRNEQEYWGKNLTVIGYGEPSFAAFYPNCYSVFGCHDSEPGNLDSSLSYEIIGWHSETEFDYIKSLISEEWRNSEKSLNDLIKDQINWKLETSENIGYDLQTLYYGCLEFQLDSSNKILETQPELDSVILANSGTEALSAYIAYQVQQNDSHWKKHDVENQLEAIQLLSSLETEVEDLDQKLREARHEKEFVSHSSGVFWTIEKIDKNQKSEFNQKSDHQDSKKALLELPESIAEQLKNLNKNQEQHNILQPEIELQQQQIFADWYKYLICLYPPVSHLESYPKPERVRDFMSHSEIATLKERITEFEQLSTELDGCKKALENALEDFNRKLKAQASETPDNQSPEYQLKSIPAHRYWQPNEPVVMVVFKTDSEQAAEVTESEDREGLECAVLRLDFSQDFSQNNKAEFIQELVEKVRETLEMRSPHQTQYLSVWRSQPWKPFLLEWEVQVTNIKTQRNYFSNFIERYYPTSLTNSDRVLIDFQPPDNLVLQQDLLKDVYSGRSLLTDYAANQHQQQIEAFFTRKRFFDDFCKDRSIEAKSGWLAQHSEALKQWLDNSQILEEEKQLLNHLLEVYEGFKKIQCLSQTLDGVNQALLGRKQTLQLAIDDPIGFECDRWFVEDVRDAVQDSITSAPQPLNFFNPIRAGVLKILRLRLVDTFGRVRDLAWEQTITPEHLTASQDNGVNLPPRIVQPARVQFRWLSSNAKHITEEAASHPSLNPICGWILVDRIDHTMEVYTTQGDSLGELEIKKAGSQRRRASPGSEYAVESVETIPNPHLRRVIRYLDECDDP